MIYRFLDVGVHKQTEIFHNLDLELDTSKITVLIGANGSGKTVFCDLLGGIEPSYPGTIELDNKKLSEWDAGKLREKIFYLSQEPLENFTGSSLWNKNNWKTMEHEFSESNTSVIKHSGSITHNKKHFWELSIGTLRKIACAKMIASDAEFWIIDSTLFGIGKDLSENILNLISKRRKKGKGALISTHRQDIYTKLADELWIIRKKKISRI